jgi:acyl-CoA synthetase (AMP-forming)/AMP-acid ligase II
MSRETILAAGVPPYAARRAAIEAEPLPVSLFALLEEAAKEVPASEVLHFVESNERYSYGDLLAAVKRVSAAFSLAGIKKGSHVGVMLPNIYQFPLTWLALARLGAVMIPVNVRYTSRELHYVLDDGEADYLVIHDKLVSKFETVPQALPRISSDHVIVVGDKNDTYLSWDRLLADAEADVKLDDTGARDDLLNIQYTSGTTGFPKGCMLTQLYWLTIGKVNALRDGRRFPNILSATPFFYMDPMWLLVMTLFQRATLHVTAQQSGSRFMRWVRELNISFCLLPNIVLKQPPAADDRLNELVKVNIYGFPRANHAELEERFDLIARESYGMTEIGSAIFTPIEATEMVGSGTCGLASPFRELMIADEAGHAVPEGEPGELLVRGQGILAGYYRRPEANVSAFRGDWFRTGDLFRRDKQGYFYIEGRIKDMIRRAGENIAAREVETVVCGVEEVAEAAALPVPDDTRGEEVKIYVVPKGDYDPAQLSKRIIAHCTENLASFKVPRYIEYRSELPKTPSEKVAKHLLKSEKPDLRVGSWDRLSSG